MTQKLLGILAFCTAGVVLGAQAQSSSDTDKSTSGSSTYGNTENSSSWRHGKMGAASGMSHNFIRASQLKSSQITGSSGQSLGTINDVIINPHSGRVEFAVISLSNNGNTTENASGSGTSPGGSSAGSSSTLNSATLSSPNNSATGSTTTGVGLGSENGKLVAVPWSLLRSSAGGSGSYNGSSSSGIVGGSSQLNFTFNGDVNKLQSAPAFDESTDLSQASWRQNVFSHFGLTPGASTGGAESPGGSSSFNSNSQNHNSSLNNNGSLNNDNPGSTSSGREYNNSSPSPTSPK